MPAASRGLPAGGGGLSLEALRFGASRGAVNRLLAYLRPFESGSSPSPGDHAKGVPTSDKVRFTGMANELSPVNDADRDQIRLLAHREIVAVLRRERRTWVHTVREEFATYYPLVDLRRWQGGNPFIQIGRHAVVSSLR